MIECLALLWQLGCALHLVVATWLLKYELYNIDREDNKTDIYIDQTTRPESRNLIENSQVRGIPFPCRKQKITLWILWRFTYREDLIRSECHEALIFDMNSLTWRGGSRSSSSIRHPPTHRQLFKPTALCLVPLDQGRPVQLWSSWRNSHEDRVLHEEVEAFRGSRWRQTLSTYHRKCQRMLSADRSSSTLWYASSTNVGFWVGVIPTAVGLVVESGWLQVVWIQGHEFKFTQMYLEND